MRKDSHEITLTNEDITNLHDALEIASNHYNEQVEKANIEGNTCDAEQCREKSSRLFELMLSISRIEK